jgi:hypothetical protein
MKKFRDFLFASIYYTLPFLVLGICYLAFAFIARDLDPGRWLLWTPYNLFFLRVIVRNNSFLARITISIIKNSFISNG